MGKKIFADLHNHTTASDGDFTPDSLIKQAKKFGINAIGVTDHDTLDGLKEAVASGKRYGIEVVPGVEISIRFKRPYFTGTLHLLCYFSVNRLLDNEFLNKFKEILAKGRGDSLVRARVDEINKFFGPKGKQRILKRNMRFADIEKLSPNASRRHFAIALQESFGLADKDTVNAIIGNNSPAYLPSGIELNAVAEFIRTNHLFAVLAHPAAGSFPGEGHYKEVFPPLEIVEKILPEFIETGIKGVEVYYPGHIEDHQSLMKSWAQKYSLLMTGGSDCHDETDRPLGVEGINESQYSILKEALV